MISCHTKFSTKALKWLNYEAKKDNIYIQHALNEGEAVIGKYKVDGFCEKTNTVYEFHGIYWHGHPSFFYSKMIHPNRDVTFGELYCKTMHKELFIKKLGYNLVVMWEHEWDALLCKTKKEVESEKTKDITETEYNRLCKTKKEVESDKEKTIRLLLKTEDITETEYNLLCTIYYEKSLSEDDIYKLDRYVYKSMFDVITKSSLEENYDKLQTMMNFRVLMLHLKNPNLSYDNTGASMISEILTMFAFYGPNDGLKISTGLMNEVIKKIIDKSEFFAKTNKTQKIFGLQNIFALKNKVRKCKRHGNIINLFIKTMNPIFNTFGVKLEYDNYAYSLSFSDDLIKILNNEDN